MTIVRPVHNESDLHQIDAMSISELRPEFQTQLNIVKECILSKDAQVKSLHGKELNGLMYAGLIRSYVDAINQGGVPTISSAWEDISSKQCRVRVYIVRNCLVGFTHRIIL